MKKLLTRLFIAMLILTFTPTMNTQAKAKIKLNKTKISLQRGKTYTLKVKGTKKKVKWSSNKKTIATVTRKGKVTAQKPGTAVITAKSGQKSVDIPVTVVAAGMKEFKILAGTNAETSFAYEITPEYNITKNKYQVVIPDAITNVYLYSKLAEYYTEKWCDIKCRLPDQKRHEWQHTVCRCEEGRRDNNL